MSDEINRRNILSIHEEQKRLRDLVSGNSKVIAELQSANFQLSVELADLRQQFNLYRAMHSGTGATSR